MGLLRRRARAAVLALVGLLALGAASEAELKSALVFRVARLVVWPQHASAGESLRVAVLGDDPFADTLVEMLDGETLHDRPLVVRRVYAPEEILPVEVLVVSGEPRPLDALWAALGDAPVLTVGDAPDFARRGGMIGLVRDGPRMGLEIHRGALDARGLHVSSQLLGVATVVDADD